MSGIGWPIEAKYAVMSELTQPPSSSMMAMTPELVRPVGQLYAAQRAGTVHGPWPAAGAAAALGSASLKYGLHFPRWVVIAVSSGKRSMSRTDVGSITTLNGDTCHRTGQKKMQIRSAGRRL